MTSVDMLLCACRESDRCVLFAVKLFVTVHLSCFPLEDESMKRDLSSVEGESLVGVRGLLLTESVSKLKDVRRLEGLVRAHTLLAAMADRTSPEHQLNLLRAYVFVLRIWQVLPLYPWAQ